VKGGKRGMGWWSINGGLRRGVTKEKHLKKRKNSNVSQADEDSTL